jgi:hypothetical protein
LDALWEKRKGAIAQGVQIIDSRRLPLFICTESAEEPIYVRLQRMDAMVSTVWTDTGSGFWFAEERRTHCLYFADYERLM